MSAFDAAPGFATDPPIGREALRRMILQWRRSIPTSGLGAHLRRRQGRSLEFREHRLHQRGDDVRMVDWRASLRLPRASDLLARSFESEGALTLIILLDNRPEMAAPEAMPKLLYGLWAFRALVDLALGAGDEAIAIRLFEGAGAPFLRLRGGDARLRARDWAEAVWRGRAGKPEAAPRFADLDRIARRLKPAGATILISDLLFEDSEGVFLRFARKAQNRRGSFSALLLDSLEHEIGLLRAAAEFRLLDARGATLQDARRFDEAAFHGAAEAVLKHLAQRRQALQAGGLDWPRRPVLWPEAASGGSREALKSLFVRSFPRLPMLAGLSLGGAE